LNERLRSVQQSIQAMIDSEIFRSSCELHDYSNGVKASCIRIDSTREQTTADYKAVFGYDFHPVPNPMSMGCFKSCRLEHGGHCGDADLVSVADNLSANLHFACKGWAKEFPVLLQLKVDSFSRFAILGRLVGGANKGFGMINDCIFLERHPDHPWDCVDLVSVELLGGRLRYEPKSSHTFCLNLLNDAAAESANPDPTAIESVLQCRWNFVRETAVDKFRLRLMDVESETMLSCVDLDKSRKRKVPESECDTLPFGLGQVKKEPSALRIKKPAKGPVGDVDSDRERSSASIEAPSDNDPESSVDGDDDHPPHDSDPGTESSSSVGVEPWNAKGLKSWDVASSARLAKCLSCGEPCEKGTLRMDYRSKVSDKLGDQRRVHATPECALQLPVDTRKRDCKILKRWMRNTDLSAVPRLAFQNILEAFESS
jgi:hypothetical protein